METRKQGSFYLAIGLNGKWTHIYRIFNGGKRCGEVEDLGRATDENLADVAKKYPNKAISPLGGFANMI